jgi:16S rRNA A1518/A1519 N6-dimethyltransferase RsmA/KsgA/DIM1 with predicted DNA glycosylase/AP lyase activity
VDDEIFLNFIKKAFLAPRKKLVKNLTNSWFDKQKVLEIFNNLDLEENVRWEDLTLQNFIDLIKNIT